MTPRAAGRVALALWIIALACIGGAFVNYVWLVSTGRPLPPEAVVTGLIVLFVYSTVGYLIASRRPDNRLGWLYSLTSLGLAILSAVGGYTLFVKVILPPEAVPAIPVIALIFSLVALMLITVIGTFLLLLFPDGHLPSARWVPVVWFILGSMGLGVVGAAFQPGPMLLTSWMDNPLGVDSGLALGLSRFSQALLATCFAASAVSVVVRYRRAVGVERLQLKWIATAAIVMAVAFIAGTLAAFAAKAFIVGNLLSLIGLAALPIASLFAILRYRLYDIDLIINRALVYGALTGVLAGLYSAAIALFQRLFINLTGERSDAAIVLTTLVLAAAFTPVKNALQKTADRRFPERLPPKKRLGPFVEQMRAVLDASDSERLARRLIDEAAAAFDAACARLRLDGASPPERVLNTGAWSDPPAIAMPVAFDGTRIGTLELGPRLHAVAYSKEDRATLEETASIVAEAITLSRRALTRY